MTPLSISLVTTIIGREMISTTVKDVGSSLYSLIYEGPEDINKLLKELDIHAQIKVVESLMDNLHEQQLNETVNISLNLLHQIICEINHDIIIIKYKINNDTSRYFNRFRSSSYHKDLKKLTNDKEILDKRLEILIKILSVNSCLKVEKKPSIISNLIKDI